MKTSKEKSQREGKVWYVDGNPAFRLLNNYQSQECITDWEKDIWTSLSHFTSLGVCCDYLSNVYHLKKREIKKVAPHITSYVTQASEFHNNAKLASLRTSPLLHYYSFLNLAKAYILCTSPRSINSENFKYHGLRLVPRRDAIDLRKDILEVKDKGVWRALFRATTGREFNDTKSFKIENLFMFCKGITIEVEKAFGYWGYDLQIVDQAVKINRKRKELWLQICFDKDELKGWELSEDAVRKYLYTTAKQFQAVSHSDKSILCFEQKVPSKYISRNPNHKLQEVVSLIKKLNLTKDVFNERYRLPLFDIGKVPGLSELMVVYSLMYYYGMLVRYYPFQFNKLLDEGYLVVTDSFMRNCSFSLASQFEEYLYDTQIHRS